VAGKEIDHVLELTPGRCFARNLEATAVKAGSVLIFLLVCARTKVIHSELSGCADGARNHTVNGVDRSILPAALQE
jgi:hypothetical protein